MHLSSSLSKPLPGMDAHYELAARGSMGNRYFSEPNQHTKDSAVMILFYEKEGEIYFPLIQRPLYDGVHSGQIALPGGKVETEDEDFKATALRETEEEIGVDRNKIDVIGQLTPLFVFVSNYLVRPYLGRILEKPCFVPEPAEVDEVLEISLQDLREMPILEKKINVKNVLVHAPYFPLNGKVVWGATAMILNELRELLN